MTITLSTQQSQILCSKIGDRATTINLRVLLCLAFIQGLFVESEILRQLILILEEVLPVPENDDKSRKSTSKIQGI